MHVPHSRFVASFLAAFLCLFATAAAAQEISIERPGPRDFVVDYANLIEPEDETRIKEVCDKLLTEQAIPIIVVTIEQMAEYGGGDMRIETFAMFLFNQWEIGAERVNDQYWNKGILLLVSNFDRRARIELGDGWPKEADVTAMQVMDEQIIPRFKQGDFSEGILKGVEALDKMARNEKLPRKPISWTSVALVAGFIGLAIFTIVSLIRRGASGWAWLFWGVVFSALGYFLYSALSSRGGGGGGFSGGSFGGGFSGGGGATGSW
jgi:uncharacterized protein